MRCLRRPAGRLPTPATGCLLAAGRRACPRRQRRGGRSASGCRPGGRARSACTLIASPAPASRRVLCQADDSVDRAGSGEAGRPRREPCYFDLKTPRAEIRAGSRVGDAGVVWIKAPLAGQVRAPAPRRHGLAGRPCGAAGATARLAPPACSGQASGAARQNARAIRFSGVQNPLPPATSRSSRRRPSPCRPRSRPTRVSRSSAHPAQSWQETRSADWAGNREESVRRVTSQVNGRSGSMAARSVAR